MTIYTPPSPDMAKTIFNTPEIDFSEVIKAMPREDLEKIANDQSMKLSLIWEGVIEIRRIDNPPERNEIMKIVGDMLETLDDNEVTHDALYGGQHRDRLLNLFPSLRNAGGAA